MKGSRGDARHGRATLLRSSRALSRRLGGRRVVVDVGVFPVLLALLVLAIVVAVRQLGVIVLVGVPVRAVLPFHDPARVVMGHVVVIVAVRLRGMGVLGLLALTFRSLRRHALSSSTRRPARRHLKTEQKACQPWTRSCYASIHEDARDEETCA